MVFLRRQPDTHEDLTSTHRKAIGVGSTRLEPITQHRADSTKEPEGLGGERCGLQSHAGECPTPESGG